MEKKMENEMDTGIIKGLYRGSIGVILNEVPLWAIRP